MNTNILTVLAFKLSKCYHVPKKTDLRRKKEDDVENEEEEE